MKHYPFFLLILAFAFIGCSAAAGGSGAGSGAATPSEQSMADQVIVLVNQERAKEGLAPLSSNAPLAAVAWVHSEDMRVRAYFDHINPEGDGPVERVTDAGILFSAVGENLGKGFTTAKEALEEWMNSPPHRENIMYPGFTQIGVGVVLSPTNTDLWMWTQLFRTP